MLKRTTTKAFFKLVFDKLLNGGAVSKRFCEQHGYEIEKVYDIISKQTKVFVRYVEHNKGTYIFNWDENYSMRSMFIDDYLSREMPKHELKRNEVKI